MFPVNFENNLEYLLTRPGLFKLSTLVRTSYMIWEN